MILASVNKLIQVLLPILPEESMITTVICKANTTGVDFVYEELIQMKVKCSSNSQSKEEQEV